MRGASCHHPLLGTSAGLGRSMSNRKRPKPDAPCSCGSGRIYRDCCASGKAGERPVATPGAGRRSRKPGRPRPFPLSAWPALKAHRHRIAGPWYIDAVLAVAMVGGTCLLYLPDLGLGFFMLDDPNYVVENPWIKDVSLSNLGFILTESYFANYCPLHILSYMIDYLFGGLNPATYHLSSNIWAGVVAAFVYLFTTVFLGSRLIAAAAAVLFIVHPAHVEAVAWISSRKDLVAAALALPTMMFYVLYSNRGRRQWFWYGLSLACFLLGLGGKQSVAVVPVQLFVFDIFLKGRMDWRIVIDKIPYVVLVGFFSFMTMNMQPYAGYDFDLYVISRSVVESLWLMCGFGDYVIYRERPDAGAAIAIKAVFWILPLLFVGAVVLPRWCAVSLPLTLGFWVVIGLLPAQTLGLVHPVADRYLFFPSVPLTILIAWAAFTAGRQFGRRGMWSAGLLILGVAGCWAKATLDYLAEWNDPRSIWFAAAQKSEEVNNLQYLGSHFQDAADSIETALSSWADVPEDDRRFSMAFWTGDSRLKPMLAEWDEKRGGVRTVAFNRELRDFAWQQYEKADQTRNKRVTPNLYIRRGNIQLARQNWEGARAEFETVRQHWERLTFETQKQVVEVQYNYSMGLSYWRAGEYETALPWVRKAEQLQLQYRNNAIPRISQLHDSLESRVKARATTRGE